MKTPAAGRPHPAEEMAAASATFGCSPALCPHSSGPAAPGMEAVVVLGLELHFLLLCRERSGFRGCNTMNYYTLGGGARTHKLTRIIFAGV